MSAEVSFTKRAAAELSRCFNGISVSRPASKNSGTGAANTSSNNVNNGKGASVVAGGGGEGKTGRRGSSTPDTDATPRRSSITSFRGFKSDKSKCDNGELIEVKFCSKKYDFKFSFFFASQAKVNNTTPEVGARSSNDGVRTSDVVVNMTPNKRRSSRTGPPPKAPPKTNKARRKNYLLNLNKPTTLIELFQDGSFLKRFFHNVSPLQRCTLAQVWRNLFLFLFFFCQWRGREK